MKHRRHVIAAIAALGFTLAGCRSVDTGRQSPPEPGETTISTGGDQNAPPADARAGTRSDNRDGAEPHLVGGALAGPRRPDGLTAQQAADLLYNGGLQYADGTVQQPSWVRCVANQNYLGAARGHYTLFECDIEVPRVHPYVVRLTVDDSGAATFEFLRYSS